MLLFLAILLAVLLLPLILLIAAWVWLFRSGRLLPSDRRSLFSIGLSLSTVAYASGFLLSSYFGVRPASAPKTHLFGAFVFAALMSAVVGFGAGWAGKGYGRVASCTASLLIALQYCLTVLGFFG